MKIKRLYHIASLLLALLLLCACGASVENESSATESSDVIFESLAEKSEAVSELTPTDGELRVHFLDVGQGDSIFVELPNGECMLIDASEREMAGRIISYIDSLGYKRIDHLVATHPHADHIGGMQSVVEYFDIGEVYMPEAVTDTKTFIDLLEAIEGKGLSITVVTAGLAVELGGAKGKFVAPSLIVDDMNNCSAVLHLSYGDRAFLFTGDAEIDEEGTISDNIKCDVLKVGHHGSSTSSGEYLLGKAKPQFAIISCGEGNSYGHPHKEALDRLANAGVERIYRTDISGNIIAVTNGKDLEITENNQAPSYKWLLNISTKKVHSPNCKSAADMKEANKSFSSKTLEELQELGYSLCGICEPKE